MAVTNLWSATAENDTLPGGGTCGLLQNRKRHAAGSAAEADYRA
jgi:hypothetical protein